jgi:hypothetical protein
MTSLRNGISGIISLILLICLLGIDFFYFPNLIETFVYWILVVTFFIAMSLDSRKNPNHMWLMIMALVIFLLLTFLFSVLGGDSTHGLEPNDTLYWIVIGIALIDIVSEWRRLKKPKLK